MNFSNQNEWATAAPRRILGMKTWQVAFLGVMAVLDCLVLGVGGVILIGSLPSGGAALIAPPTFTPEPQLAGPTLTPSASATPITMVFQFPSYTPYGTPAETETPTPLPTDPMEGWVRIAVTEVEIWMPGTFVGGRPQTDGEAIIASLKDKGANFNWEMIAEDLAAASPQNVLWAIDSHQGNPQIVTNVAVVYEYVSPGEPLADYANQFIGSLSDNFSLIEQSPILHPEYEVVRVVLETKTEQGTPSQIAVYAVRDQNIVWNILCFTGADEMAVRLSVFNQMVETFRVLTPP